VIARWSLRRRVGIAVGLVILAVGATISTVVFLSVERLLIDRIDNDLRLFSTRPELAGPLPPIRPGGQPPPVTTDGEAVFQPVAATMFAADGTVVGSIPSGYSDDPQPLADVSDLALDDLEGRSGTFFDLGDVEGGELRGLLQPFPAGGWVLLTQSLDQTNDVLNRALLVSAVTTLLAAGAGVLGAWRVVRRGFRPVDDMIDTAAAIAAGERDRRVEAGNDGTELGRLGAALDHMMDRLATADAEREADAANRRRFVDDASHELRTPVAAIVGYVELYEQGGVHDPEQLDRAMSRIGEAGRRAERLIDDLLTLAQLDHEVSRHREVVDLESVVEELVAETAQVTGRDVRAETDGPVMIEGDRIWLGQALANVVRNAVTYAPADQPIHVRLTGSDGTGQLSVIDHGPGVDESERARVFDRFARQDRGRGRSRGGAGLGLAIVSEIVKSHGGQVELTETPGGGATVTMRFPTRSSPQD
jgi:two-component system OmpR family sensor kinase